MYSTEVDGDALKAARDEAERGVAEGGMPFGAVLGDELGRIWSAAHNNQIQTGRWLAHAEMECLTAYLTDLDTRDMIGQLTLYATEAPCPMCAGAAIVAGVRRCVVGEDTHYPGAIDLMRNAGVQVEVLNDQSCIELVTKFRARHPDRWALLSAG